LEYTAVAQLRPGKLLGLLFGCFVAGVMIFMMFAILDGLFAGGP
jgi:hypothetical protein